MGRYKLLDSELLIEAALFAFDNIPEMLVNCKQSSHQMT